MKKFLAMLLALVMALSLVACGEKKDDTKTEGGDTATGKVYYLNFKPEQDQDWQDLAKAYTEETGVPVTVVTAASGTYNETLTAEMDKSAPPTLFVVGNQAAVDTWGDYCYDLTGTPIAGELTTDAYNLYDADGNEYLDFISGYGVFGMGRNNPVIGRAIKDAIDMDLSNMVQLDCALLSGLLAERIVKLGDITPEWWI